MSLINQMLRDLEQRRITGMEASPPGGLSASGSVTQSVNSSINSVTLSAVMATVFVSGVMVAWLSDSQQQIFTTENTMTVSPEKETSVFLSNKVPEKTNVLSAMVPPAETPTTKTMTKPDSLMMAEEKGDVIVDRKLVAKKTTLASVKPDIENIMQADPINAGKNINKIIRPLTDEQQSQQAFQRAIHMLSRNNRQGALLALEEALSYSPIHLRARETLAALLLNAGRMNEAASSLHEGLQLIPDAAPLAKLYARILTDQGDVVIAVAVLEQARPAVASDPEYHALLAAVYRQVGKHAQAARIYQQILLQRPAMASWWMGLALAQDAMGETTIALDAFQRAQRIGGLGSEVLKYIQTRIIALTSEVSMLADVSHDLDEFEE